MSSIAGRLLLSYLLVITVVLLATGIAIAGLLARYDQEITRVRLQELAAPLFTSIQQSRRQGQPTREIVQGLREQTQAAQVRLLVVGAQRRVLIDSDGTMEDQRLPTLEQGQTVGTFRQGDESWIFVQRGIGPAGVAVVARREAVFADAVAAVLPTFLGAAALALAFALALALLLSRTISRPLRELNAVVRQLAAGRYRARAAVGGPTEVRQLGGAFNDMADEIERARGSERAFLADISHELRTPLTSIHGFSQAIVEGEVTGDGVRWAGGLIQRESRRLVRMVEGLLQVARLESGVQVMARERVDLASVLDGVVAALAMQARDARVAIDQRIDALGPVLGDADKLAQLFVNLLENALKHTPAGQSVRLEAEAAAGSAVIRVRDAGSGLPEGAQARLFQRFWRGDTAQDGTGLGLAIAQAIAHAHGGRIDAANAADGGAVFTVRLPLAPTEITAGTAERRAIGSGGAVPVNDTRG